MDKQTAIEKIKKCLALSKSANEHEAAAALRQARLLMERFNVSDLEMLAAEVSEAQAKASAKRWPARWEHWLANVISRAFACRVGFCHGWQEKGKWRFVGCGAAPEIAQYAFAVLLRQLKKARAVFTKAECKRLKLINKTRRADLFCQAWVQSVATQVQQFASLQINETAIDAYIAQRYGHCKQLQTKDRNEGRKMKDRDWDAIEAGSEAGRNAQLNHGIGSAGKQPLAIGR